jgi:single-stranded-DNA-specific exonuclease
MTNKNKYFLSINNNQVYLQNSLENLEKEQDIFRYLFKLRHNNEESLKYSFHSFFKDIFDYIKDLEGAVDLFIDTITHNKKIGIIGDYDVDGTIATSILIKFFQHLEKYFKFSYTYHIPNRFKEGYGPSIFSINHLKKQNVNLIITVDSGSTSFNEIKLANQLNIKSIILDHHNIQNEIPEATFFINNQNSEKFKYLCGGGLAFVFIYKINEKLKKIIKDYEEFSIISIIDLVAVSTICDFVHLVELNRSIVYYGMKIINYKYLEGEKKINKGLDIILQYSFYNYNKNTYISSVDIGFAIGPYINVAGRLEDANIIVKFLTTEDEKELETIFISLQKLWSHRKKIQEDILINIEKNYMDYLLNNKFILIEDESIHEGVMGIIAAKLKEKYNKPTIIINVTDGIGKGSIRSIGDFHAGKFIEEAIKNKILKKGGGHQAAGGFSLDINNINELFLALKIYTENLVFKDYKEFYIDHTLNLHGLNKYFYEKIQEIGPFGVGNKELLFLFPFLIIKKIYIFSNQHLNITFTNITEDKKIKGIWFFTPDKVFENIKLEEVFHVIGYIKYINNNIEIYIVDLIKKI